MNVRKTAVNKCKQLLERSLVGEEPTDQTASEREYASPGGEEGQDWTVWQHSGEESDSATGD